MFSWAYLCFAGVILQTGIWTELYKIEDMFLKPLRIGLNMSRAHYERELHNTMEAKKNKVKGQTNFHLLLLILIDFGIRGKVPLAVGMF